MAISAEIDIGTPFVDIRPGQVETVVLKVINSGTQAVTVTGICPVLSPADGGAVAGVPTPPTGSYVVPAAGSAYFSWQVVFFVPQTATGAPASVTFTLGAVVYTSDGAVTAAPTEVVTLAKQDAAQPAAAGFFLFNSPLNSGEAAIWFW